MAVAALAGAPVFAAISASPGALNYVEGRGSIGPEQLSSKSVGSTTLEPGQTLRTTDGRVEVLLTPGVFLRLNNNSAVRMVSPGLTDTRVAVLQGQAMLEADNLQKENNLKVESGRAVTTIEKNGLYRFDANRSLVAVYDGKAQVQEGDKVVDLKGGRATDVSGTAPAKAVKFDKKAAEDDLYNWSKVRSEYLAEATAAAAPTYVLNTSGWIGPGWYWNPWFTSYTFIPGSGIIYSPFGWGFASPWAYGPWGWGYAPGYWVVPRVAGRVPGRVYVPTRPAAPTNPGVFRPAINSGMIGRGGTHFTGPHGR